MHQMNDQSQYLKKLYLCRKDIIEALASSDRNMFCSAFYAAQKTMVLSDEDLAQVLQVSGPTVNRWATGLSAPHPVGQKPILQFLLHLVENELKVLNKWTIPI